MGRRRSLRLAAGETVRLGWPDGRLPDPAVAGEYAVLAAPGAVSDEAVERLVGELARDPSLGAVVAAFSPDDPAEALAVRPDATLFRTAAWRAAGGLDPGLGAAAGADLGWRLGMLGWRVAVSRHVVVPGRVAALDPADQTLLFFRNADETELARVLPERELRRVRAEFGEVRRRNRTLRRRTDRDIGAALRDSGLLQPPGYPATPQRIVVLTADTLADAMAGPAIRAVRIAEQLAAEHEVVLATLATCSLQLDGVRVLGVDGNELRDIVRRSDVLIDQTGAAGRFGWLARSPVVFVADMYDPTLLEALEQERYRPPHERTAAGAKVVDGLRAQLRRADLVLCASERQRAFWLGMLAAEGRINPRNYDGDEDLRSLVSIVPFGTEPPPPKNPARVLRGQVAGIEDEDFVLVWGGGIYNWFDPLTLIEAIELARRELPRLRLFFLGVGHPTPSVPTMRMALAARSLADRLELTGRHVFFNEGWVPYRLRQSYFEEADVGVSTHFGHVETTFAFRTRILDYLWTGLPVISTEGDVFAELVAREDLGAVVRPEDPAELAAAIVALAADPDLLAGCGRRSAAAADQFRWATVLRPLLEFCRAPAAARDRRGSAPDPTRWLVPRRPAAVRVARALAARLLRILRVRPAAR